MHADVLTTLTNDALDRLATLLDEGHSESLTALLTTMARFHRYSWHNVCLIASQCPTATRVAGFHTWRGLGRFVRKGEKGIAILAPIVARKDARGADDDAKSVLGFRAVYVFDRADGRRAVGVPRTGITGAIGELQHAEVVTCRHGQIEIRHRRRLEISACPCYAAVRDVFMLTPPPSDTRRSCPPRRRVS